MFDIGIGWQEMLIVVVLAIIIVGPKDLPGFIKQFVQFIKKAKSMTSEVQRQLSDIAKDAELDDFNKNILDNDANLMAKNIIDPIKAVSEDIDKLLKGSDGKSNANIDSEADMSLIIGDEPISAKANEADNVTNKKLANSKAQKKAVTKPISGSTNTNDASSKALKKSVKKTSKKMVEKA